MRQKNRLARARRFDRILVLCLGNICRSPYGAGRLAGLAREGDSLTVRSAGLMGPGRPSPDAARSAALRRGLDLGPHESQLLSAELADWADLFIVMSPHQARVLRKSFGISDSQIVLLGDLDPKPAGQREIPDPLDRSEDFFMETYDRMDRCLGELFALIRDPS
ncbi:MAG: hypothetical protein ABIF09_05575 [Gemmatimonadota bacterium]